MSIRSKLRAQTVTAVESLYGGKVTNENNILLNLTSKEFEGDYTIVVFPISKTLGKSPEETGDEIGSYLLEHNEEVGSFNVIKGFLNIKLTDECWMEFISNYDPQQSQEQSKKECIVIEYCSPNTNKPLHLGLLRNIFLGYSLSSILTKAGYEVIQVCLYNDRGINISKSMLAWEKWGNGETPSASGKKGDKLVGNYYVKYGTEYKAEIKKLMSEGKTEEQAAALSQLSGSISQMTQDWEAGKKETRTLWDQMNRWVYEGFNDTYKMLGIHFDKFDYESQTYLLGKDIIKEGVKKGVFIEKEDSSIWVDLTEDGLDEKLLLRSNGTSVYMTQDIGTAIKRHDEHQMNRGIYVVADEQDYHFKVLFLTLQKAGYAWAEKLYHLSYGMVDLPSGKMKSREGTIVDADDLIDEMISTAEKHTKELGKIEDFSTDELAQLYKTIGLGALKYHLIKVDPKKRILFDPEESIDFQGHTGPFIQYSYARIQSILRKAGEKNPDDTGNGNEALTPEERDLCVQLNEYRVALQEAADLYDPSVIANYVYQLAKTFNKFYTEVPVLIASRHLRDRRIKLSEMTANLIAECMSMLGIEVPERM